MDDHCVLCGTCLEVCPNAKTFVSDLEKVRHSLQWERKRFMSLAPAYLGIFDYDKPGQVMDALLRLDFLKCGRRQRAAYVTEAYTRSWQRGR